MTSASTSAIGGSPPASNIADAIRYFMLELPAEIGYRPG
jgi:hypothetical protein